MSVTVPVQTRLAHSLAKRLDQLADAGGTTRAEVVRQMLETALGAPQPFASATDVALDRIADELSALAARIDESLTVGRKAHAAAKIAGMMLVPQDSRQLYIDTVDQAVQP